MNIGILQVDELRSVVGRMDGILQTWLSENGIISSPISLAMNLRRSRAITFPNNVALVRLQGVYKFHRRRMNRPQLQRLAGRLPVGRLGWQEILIALA